MPCSTQNHEPVYFQYKHASTCKYAASFCSLNHFSGFKDYNNLQVPGTKLFQNPIVPYLAMTFMPLAIPEHEQMVIRPYIQEPL